MTHSDMLYQSTGYFHVLFLWPIAVSDFRLLEIYKNFGLPLSTVTFTDNHADNHFYKYIYFSFEISFFIKIYFKVFYRSYFF